MCALGAVSVSDVLEVSDGPSSDNNLAIHGRPNRFILTRRSACVCVRGEGWGGVVEHHSNYPSCGLKQLFFFATFEGAPHMLCDKVTQPIL